MILKELINQESKLLRRASQNLSLSLERAKMINLTKEEISFEEGEVLDSFAAKYMRAYEVLINQVLRTALTILDEKTDNRRDDLNQAEKLGFINLSSNIDRIRILRNKIAHDYLDKEWVEIYHELIVTTPLLLSSISMSREQLIARSIIEEE